MSYSSLNDKTITKEQAEFMEVHGLEAVQQYPSRLDESTSACGGHRLSVLQASHSSAKSTLCTGQWNYPRKGSD